MPANEQTTVYPQTGPNASPARLQCRHVRVSRNAHAMRAGRRNQRTVERCKRERLVLRRCQEISHHFPTDEPDLTGHHNGLPRSVVFLEDVREPHQGREPTRLPSADGISHRRHFEVDEKRKARREDTQDRPSCDERNQMRGLEAAFGRIVGRNPFVIVAVRYWPAEDHRYALLCNRNVHGHQDLQLASHILFASLLALQARGCALPPQVCSVAA